MSLKNDIDMVREELTSEEKFFEKSVVIERFLKKNKTLIVSAVVIIVLGVSANIVYEINKESKATSANASLSVLLENDSDKAALSQLEESSPSLHDVYMYSKALKNKELESLKSLESSKTLLIAELAHYESLTTIEQLKEYTLSENAIYKDLAQVRIAVMYIEKGDTQSAHESLRFISDNSPLINIVKLLLHYGVK